MDIVQNSNAVRGNLISLNNRLIEYTLRVSARARRVRLTVYRDGRLVVTTPARVGHDFVARFLQEKSAWILEKIDHFVAHPVVIHPVVQAFPKRLTKKEYAEYREKARIFVHNKITEWNAHYGFRVHKISIKNQKTRWGSCSRFGNINFNYKIALIPEHLADYIVVHELCHLGELNHSQRFWALVERTIPDYKKRREELRGLGLA